MIFNASIGSACSRSAISVRETGRLELAEALDLAVQILEPAGGRESLAELVGDFHRHALDVIEMLEIGLDVVVEILRDQANFVLVQIKARQLGIQLACPPGQLAA